MRTTLAGLCVAGAIACGTSSTPSPAGDDGGAPPDTGTGDDAMSGADVVVDHADAARAADAADDATEHDASGEGGPSAMVTWEQGCWYLDPSTNKRYQAMKFTLKGSTPMALEGTLFFTLTCDPAQGTDNLNDTGATTPPGSWLFFFIHHPDERNTSADWWIGSSHSGCIDYGTAPDC